MNVLAARAPGRVAVVYLDLENGQKAELNASASFESASLVKLPILVELYRRFGTGQLKPDERLTLEARFRVGGSGSLRKEPDGSRWSLAQLAELMITRSDNIATDMLLDRLGLDSLEAQMKSLGLKGTTVRRTIFDFAAIERGRDNLTTAADMARLLAGIAKRQLPGSDQMLAILEKQERGDMLSARLPRTVTTAHKTGELTGVLHDAGIVTTPRGRYVLVMLGAGFPDRDAMVRYWAGFSAEVYRAFTSPPGSRAPAPRE